MVGAAVPAARQSGACKTRISERVWDAPVSPALTRRVPLCVWNYQILAHRFLGTKWCPITFTLSDMSDDSLTRQGVALGRPFVKALD
jgi:hypothetical protein